MNEEILAFCRAMGASEDQEELLIPLAQAARALLAARLKEGTTPEDCGPVFPLGVAMVVMDHMGGLTGGGSAGGLASFTAGDLTIRTREEGGSTAGKSLSAQAEELLAPWIRGGGFAFREVEG